MLFIPDGKEKKEALSRTTHLCIAAHQDDIEFMAYAPIAECFGRKDRWFCGVVVSDGAGSPRNGPYEAYTDEKMKAVRAEEQKKAAVLGEYGALFLLGHPSKQIKNPADREVVKELVDILRATRPRRVYLHNLADKHETHIGSALKAIAALRALSPEEMPEEVVGCEVWRGLDWMNDSEKILLDCGPHPNLARAMSEVFDSQIVGGKRYDLAAEGRRAANATCSESHACDTYTALNFGMDLTPLVRDKSLDPAEYVTGYIRRFEAQVRDTLRGLMG